MFVKIGKDAFLESDEIEFVWNINNKASRDLAREYITTGKATVCTSGKRRQTLIRTKSGKVYISPVGFNTLRNKLIKDNSSTAVDDFISED